MEPAASKSDRRTIDHLPRVEDCALGRRVPANGEDSRWSWSRRGFLQRALGAATAMSLSSLAVLPPGRKALAGHTHTPVADGYQMWEAAQDGPCAPGGYAEGHNCNPGCGPSPVLSGGCNTTGGHTGWFKTEGCKWALRNDQCWPGGYDGWHWKITSGCDYPCNSFKTYRCHDGWRVDAGCTNPVLGICRWTIGCEAL